MFVDFIQEYIEFVSNECTMIRLVDCHDPFFGPFLRHSCIGILHYYHTEYVHLVSESFSPRDSIPDDVIITLMELYNNRKDI
jgi:hypothetical protein